MSASSKYSSKVLELVAKEISGYFTGTEIVKLLEEFGLKRDVIQYPNTKWWTINEAFKYIQQNYEDPDGHISKLIMDFLHPLQHNLNNETSEKLADKVEKYLKYDNFYVENTGKEYIIFSSDEMEEIHSIPEEVIEQEEDDKKKDEEKIKKNAELIKTLRDNHQSLMDVVEIFCQNSKKPTKELNDAYLFLVKKIENIIKQLDLKHYQIYFYKPFKKDIYTAEYEWNGDGSIFSPIKLTPKLSWDAVRPHMYETHSKISEIYRMTEETEEMSDDEKRLEQINALISEKRTIKTTPKTDGVKKMEILHKYEDKKTPKKTLKNSVVRFDDTIPAIFVDEVEIPLPEYGKEHYFCRAVWKRKANEAVDWSKVYNEMEGKSSDFIPDKNLWRYVYDAKNDVNKRVKDITGTTENLFDWNDKTIKRLY